MAGEFKLDPRASKAEVMDQYKELLDTYQKKVSQLEAAEKRLSEGERHTRAETVKVAGEASVQAVIETLGQLRGLFNRTLGDLTDRMTAQAEKLESYRNAIAIQEKRLQERYDIEQAADALKKLVAAYEERKQKAESEFASLVTAQEIQHKDKAQNLDREFNLRKDALVKEIDEIRTKWKEEQERTVKLIKEQKEQEKKDREREEAEYVYERDRARKLEEDAYVEKRVAQEKELAAKKQNVEKDLTERVSAMAARETELKQLKVQVEQFPATLKAEVDKVRQQTTEALGKEMRQKEALLNVERDWERKMYEQKIQHLELLVASREKQLESLQVELSNAQAQVNDVAKKAIEGASLSKAYQSVNKIALEQARRQESRATE